jgi:phage FluMu protein Com
MKRIITCPKCEAKLAVFDLGKPINQKCPKCGNAFVVESEEKKEPAKEEAKAEEPKKAEEPPKAEEPKKAEEAKPSDGPAEKEEKALAPAPDAGGEKVPARDAETPKAPVAEKTPAEDKKESEAKDKEIKLKKPAESPAPAAKPRAPVKSEPSSVEAPAVPETPAAGHSLLFPAVVVGLLLLIAVMQVMTKMRADKQYKTLIEHLQFIETKLK